MSRVAVDAILQPGPDKWLLWIFSAKDGTRLESEITPKILAPLRHVLLALPTRSILSVPLWVATEGDSTELAELELSSRHLLRKGAELHSLPVAKMDGRLLVLGLASTDDPEAAGYVAKAESYEFPARLLVADGADVLIWRELGDLCFGFYRNNECVFFATSGESQPGPAFCGLLSRTAMRLHSEGVVTRRPAKLRLEGNFSKEDCEALGHALRLDWELVTNPAPPLAPEAPSNPVPPAARSQIERRSQWRRLAFFTAIGLAVYLLIALGAAADLFFRNIQLRQLAAELAKLEPAAVKAQKLVTSWRELRPAVDPTAFAIDQLDAIASQIPGEQVRLTQYNQDRGRLLIAGEAADVSQAYEFFEKVKKVPMLQDYDWTSHQPQLAGRNKVRFEMEGVRPDAETGKE